VGESDPLPMLLNRKGHVGIASDLNIEVRAGFKAAMKMMGFQDRGNGALHGFTNYVRHF